MARPSPRRTRWRRAAATIAPIESEGAGEADLQRELARFAHDVPRVGEGVVAAGTCPSRSRRTPRRADQITATRKRMRRTTQGAAFRGGFSIWTTLARDHGTRTLEGLASDGERAPRPVTGEHEQAVEAHRGEEGWEEQEEHARGDLAVPGALPHARELARLLQEDHAGDEQHDPADGEEPERPEERRQRDEAERAEQQEDPDHAVEAREHVDVPQHAAQRRRFRLLEQRPVRQASGRASASASRGRGSPPCRRFDQASARAACMASALG